MLKRLSLLLLMTVLFVSCDNGGAGNAIQTAGSKTVGVTLQIQVQSSAEKVLSISSGTADINNIAYYEYKATPKWTSVDWNSVQGEQSNWTELDPNDTIWFTQGLWYIEVRAYAAGRVLLCEGNKTCYIRTGISSIEIPISRLAGNGQIDISIQVPELSAGGDLTLDYKTFGGEISIFSNFNSSRSNNIITFTGTVPVPAGSYMLNFRFGDSNVNFNYGETYVAEVFANMTTTVTGELALGNLVRVGSTIESFNDKDVSISFVCMNDATTYAWYVNDVRLQNTDKRFFVYTPTEYGNFNLECRLDDSDQESNIARAVLHVRKAIAVRLHFENNSVLTLNTFADTISKNNLSSYLTSIYEPKWYTAAEDGEGGGGTEYDSDALFDDDIDLYAHRHYYTVTFDKNYNSDKVILSTDTISGYHGTALGTLPSITITRAQSELPPLVLEGWATVRDGNIFIDESTLLTGNVTYYAKWIEIDTGGQGLPGNDKYRVIFAVFNPDENPPQYHYIPGHGNGSIITTSDYIHNIPGNNKLIIPDGYDDVNGWYRRFEIDGQGNVLLSNKFDTEHDVVTGNMFLYANPVHDSDQRTVTFDTHGGTSISPKTAYRFSQMAAPDPPSRPNRKFMGWYKDDSYTQLWNFNIDYIYDDITLHALWLSEQARDYLENTSESNDCYIDTGVVPDSSTRIVMEFNYSGNRDVLLAGTSSPAWGIKADHVRRTFDGIYVGNDDIQATGVNYSSNPKKWTIEFSYNYGLRVDGAIFGRPSSSSLSTANTIRLFKGSGDTYSAVGKCYSVQIYKGTTMVRDFKAYIKPNDDNNGGIAGMFDNVTGGFYTSAGSGAFEAHDDNEP